MRQYRGLTKNGSLVYGWYAEVDGKHYIIPDDAFITHPREFLMGHIEVIPETVGQSTGLKDKNDKEIYEGDIVKWKNQIAKKEYQGSIWLVVWDKDYAKFTVKYKGGGKSSDSIFPLFTETSLEIIGNIHQNPELLK